MVFSKRYIGLLVATISFVWSSQVQLITMHKKSNGTLLRIVASSIIDIENIAGWSGQENWFYISKMLILVQSPQNGKVGSPTTKLKYLLQQRNLNGKKSA